MQKYPKEVVTHSFVVFAALIALLTGAFSTSAFLFHAFLAGVCKFLRLFLAAGVRVFCLMALALAVEISAPLYVEHHFSNKTEVFLNLMDYLV